MVVTVCARKRHQCNMLPSYALLHLVPQSSHLGALLLQRTGLLAAHVRLTRHQHALMLPCCSLQLKTSLLQGCLGRAGALLVYS